MSNHSIGFSNRLLDGILYREYWRGEAVYSSGANVSVGGRSATSLTSPRHRALFSFIQEILPASNMFTFLRADLFLLLLDNVNASRTILFSANNNYSKQKITIFTVFKFNTQYIMNRQKSSIYIQYKYPA